MTDHSTALTCWRCRTHTLQTIGTILVGDTAHTILWCDCCEMPQQISINERGIRKILLAPVVE